MTVHSFGRLAAVCALAICSVGARAETQKASKDKIPVTTSSDEARQLYLKGRDLFEKLRATDAHKLYLEAVAKDKDFALAYVGVANSSGSAKEFFEAVNQAMNAAGKVSEGERLLIQALDAGVKGNATRQKELLVQLTKMYPRDERAHNQLGLLQFGRQEYPAAIESFKKATTINPSFSQPYNQLGYAYRFIKKYPEAEQAFKKYIELIPDDPNPYDSYAELLMKVGRHEESIQNYQKALAIDPNFIASYIGIGNNQMFMDKGEEARKTFAKMIEVSRRDNEKRQALFWTSQSYVHEGATDKALAEVDKMMAIAKAANDTATVAGDFNLIGNILLEADKPDEALAKFKQQLETIDTADVPAEVKEAARRNSLFDQARVALAKKDLAGAKEHAKTYGTQVAQKKIPFEVRQHHELLGRIAIAEGKHAVAVTELGKANQQDPRVLYLSAVALQGKGDVKKARAMADEAAKFNGLAGNYGYVRKKAQGLMAKS